MSDSDNSLLQLVIIPQKGQPFNHCKPQWSTKLELEMNSDMAQQHIKNTCCW